jgi:hypothetical protein
MNWNQQIKRLKQTLRGKSRRARAKYQKRDRERQDNDRQTEPVIVSGDVSPAFLDRMRRKGVRVEVRP